MLRMKKALMERPAGEGILSISLASFGVNGYSEFEERLDMLVRAGLDQLLIISYNSDIFRLAEIAPSEQKMVSLGITHGKYAEMFLDNAAFVRRKYPDLPIIATPTIGDAISFGIDNFIAACKEAGIDAMDTAQYPAIPDPCGFRRKTVEAGLGFICAVNGGAIGPDDTEKLAVMDEVVKTTAGEMFYVPAIPGTHTELIAEKYKPFIDRIRRVQAENACACPVVAIGGINTAQQAHDLVHTSGVDGIHFSSAFMKRIFAGQSLPEIEAWLREVKDAMRK